MFHRSSSSMLVLAWTLVVLTVGVLALQHSNRLAPLLPPSSSLQQLARSPASALLASNFYDFERQREFAGPRPTNEPAGRTPPLALPSKRQQTALASKQPHYSSSVDGFRLDQYHPLEEINGYFEQLAKRHGHVQLFTIGQTEEGRPMRAVEIINNATDPDYVWLDSLTHAREWITGTTILYIIDQLVARPDPRAALYRKNYIIVPVVNPDGYAYTWTTNRMWRKNRSHQRKLPADNKCVGADLNRNFDHSFGGEGASLDPCSHIYAGAFPFSEPETRSMADLLWSLKDRVKFYLTIHSFNQLWACPYAHTMEPTQSVEKHMKVLRAIQQAVFRAEGETYEIGPLSTKLYVGSGFGIDFAYDKCHIEHSYLVELRDKGAHGFLLPQDQIMPTARETLAGLQAGLKQVFGGH